MINAATIVETKDQQLDGRHSQELTPLDKKQGKVLLVEDDVDLNLSLALRLRRAGFEVTSVYDGIKALEKGVLEEPDLILLDLGLPRMHGFKVLHRLKMLPMAYTTPVVILTGDPNPRVNEIADNWGIKEVFRKPFSSKDLVKMVEQILDGSDHD